MSVYWEIIKFNYLRYLAYPIDTITIAVHRLIIAGLLILFWSIASRNGIGETNFRQIISYFLVSGAVNELSFARGFKVGRQIQKLIKRGQLNIYVIRPTPLIPHIILSIVADYSGVSIVISLIYLVAGILLNPPLSLLNILLFIVFLFTALILSISINLLLGTIQFHTKEAGAFKNVLDHISRVLSGAVIPLYFFPYTLKQVIQLLPFSAMVYAPTIALQQTASRETIIQLTSAILWALILFPLSITMWNKSLRNYDAAGI